MSMSYKNVLERLKEERINRNKSQAEMGQLIHMSQSHYSKIEQGKRHLTYYEIQCLCESDIDSFYVFTGMRSPRRSNEHFQKFSYEELVVYLKIIYGVIEYLYICKPSENGKCLYENVKYSMGVITLIERNNNVFGALRRILGCNQRKMSEIVQVDIKKLRGLENGKVLPDSEIIWRMYYLYGIPPALIVKSKTDIINTIDNLLCAVDEDCGKELLGYLLQICSV